MLRFHRGPLYDAAQDGGGGAGGGGGSTAAFDPAAFRTQILGDFNKVLTDFGKALKADLKPAPAAAEQAAAAAAADSAADSAASGAVAKIADPAVAAQVRALERRNAELDAQFKTMKAESDATKVAAERKEQDATVRTKLNKFRFADEQAAEDAFEIFGSKVKRNEDGNFVGSDGTPLDQFLEEGLAKKPYLLAPREVAGAGARSGRAAQGAAPLALESIKPGMSQADMAAAAAQISAILKG